MKSKPYVIFAICAFGLLPLLIASAESQNQDAGNITETQAVHSALAYFGLDMATKNDKYDTLLVSKCLIQNDNTPFAASQMIGKEVYKIELKNVTISFGQDNDKQYKRDFRVYIDPANGALLSIYSLADNAGSADTLPEPSYADADRKLENRDIHIQQIIQTPPKVSFIEALSVSWKNPGGAKIIRAIPVIFSTKSKDSSAAWLVILRGCEFPMKSANPPGSKQPPVNLRNSVLCMINAESGLFEFMTTAP